MSLAYLYMVHVFDHTNIPSTKLTVYLTTVYTACVANMSAWKNFFDNSLNRSTAINSVLVVGGHDDQMQLVVRRNDQHKHQYSYRCNHYLETEALF